MNRRYAGIVAGAVGAWVAGTAGQLRAADEAAKPVAVVESAAQAPKGTLDNLQAAYQGESNAKARYDAFALKADEEGYKSVAALFRAAAASEALHARKHADAIRKLGAEPRMEAVRPDVKSTKENVEAALKGETDEKDSMYPAFVKQAEADKNKSVALSFMGAMASEASHAKLFAEALANLEQWKAGDKPFTVCMVCGYTVMGKPPASCPICKAPRSKFEAVK
jgi:rubrerythrin